MRPRLSVSVLASFPVFSAAQSTSSDSVMAGVTTTLNFSKPEPLIFTVRSSTGSAALAFLRGGCDKPISRCICLSCFCCSFKSS